MDVGGRFDDWLRAVEVETAVGRVRAPARRRNGRLRATSSQRLIALAEPLASRSVSAPHHHRGGLLPEWSSLAAKKAAPPLRPLSRGSAEERARHLEAAVAAAANLPDFDPSHRLWPLLPTGCEKIRVPPTLSLCGDRLYWHDTTTAKLVVASWRWDGKLWRGLTKRHRNRLATRLATKLQPAFEADSSDDDEDSGGALHSKKTTKILDRRARNPIAIIKVFPGAHFRGCVGEATAQSGYTCTLVHDGAAVDECVQALFAAGPTAVSFFNSNSNKSAGDGAACLVIQSFVRPKGPTAWTVRAVVPAESTRAKPLNLTTHRATDADRRLAYAWVISDTDPYMTHRDALASSTQPRAAPTTSAPSKKKKKMMTTVVRSPPSAVAWAEPKDVAFRVLRALNEVLKRHRARLDELAVDCVQDDAAVWWVTQIKGHRLAAPTTSTGANDDAAEPAAAAALPASLGPPDSEDEAEPPVLLDPPVEKRRWRGLKPGLKYVSSRLRVTNKKTIPPLQQQHHHQQTGAGDDDELRPEVLDRQQPPGKTKRRCAGDFCREDIAAEDQHGYAVKVQHLYAVPRKAVVDGRAANAGDAFAKLLGMSRLERHGLYDEVHVCANCHYRYVGRERMHNVRARALRRPAYGELLTDSFKSPDDPTLDNASFHTRDEPNVDAALPILAATQRPSPGPDDDDDDNDDVETVYTAAPPHRQFGGRASPFFGPPMRDLAPTSPILSPSRKVKSPDARRRRRRRRSEEEEEEEEERPGGAEDFLRAAMADIDAIHAQADEGFARAAVTAVDFLSAVDASLDRAYEEGRNNQDRRGEAPLDFAALLGSSAMPRDDAPGAFVDGPSTALALTTTGDASPVPNAPAPATWDVEGEVRAPPPA